MNIDEATQYLCDSFHSIYCDTCEYSSERHFYSDCCDYCNRKQMGWSINKDYARKLAEKILGGVK